MSFRFRRKPRGSSSQRPVPAARSAWARLITVLLFAVLVGSAVWVVQTYSGDPAAPETVGGAGAAALALVALAYVRARRRRIRRAGTSYATPAQHEQTSTDPAEAPAEETNESDESDAVDAPEDPDAVEPAWLRALKLHVRTLETALEEQNASLTRAQAELDENRRGGDDLERVLVTVEALRERVKGNPESESVLNRVEAAVNRLSSSSVPGRPALHAPVPAARAALMARSNPVSPPVELTSPETSPAPSPAPDLHPPAAAPEAPPEAPAEAPTKAEEAEEAAEPAQVHEEKVLPVPLPPVPLTTRTSRWRRRGAA